MRTFQLILIFLFISIQCLGQTKNQGEITPYLTGPSDSVTYYLLLDSIQIKEDTIISINYSTVHTIGDKNGISVNYNLTKKNDKTEVRIIEGCKSLERDIIYYIKGREIFKYYFDNQIDTIEGTIDSWLYQSHDKGFYTKVYIHGNEVYSIRVNNHQFITKSNTEKDKRVVLDRND